MPYAIARRCAVLIALALFVLASMGAAPPSSQEKANSQAPDRVLVKFRAGTDASAQAAIHRKNGGTVAATIQQLGVHVVKVPAGSVASKVAAYAQDPSVQYAEPDYVASAVGKPAPAPDTSTTTPNDQYFSKQWGMTKVGAPAAWGVTKGNSSITIAILDTGVKLDHPDLASKLTGPRQDFTGSRGVNDVYGHGTHVAGIAAAATNNGTGVAGLGYDTSLMVGKVLDDSGSGYYSWIAEGVTWAADNGAKVINMSLGGEYNDQTLQEAVDYAWGKGVVIVAAAGNNGSSTQFYPAAYPNCIAVGATDSRDRKPSWSNFGSWVDVAAPGVDIYSTTNNGAYGYMSGTSMASPHVAGLAALVWATGYGTTNSQVRSRIELNTDRIAAGLSHYGRINAYKAVR